MRDDGAGGHVVGDLHVDDGRQVAALEAAGRVDLRHEEVGLGRRVGLGAEELVGAADHARRLHAGPVGGVLRVDEPGAVGDAGKGEVDAGALGSGPVDGALVIRHVDAVHRRAAGAGRGPRRSRSARRRAQELAMHPMKAPPRRRRTVTIRARMGRACKPARSVPGALIGERMRGFPGSPGPRGGGWVDPVADQSGLLASGPGRTHSGSSTLRGRRRERRRARRPSRPGPAPKASHRRRSRGSTPARSSPATRPRTQRRRPRGSRPSGASSSFASEVSTAAFGGGEGASARWINTAAWSRATRARYSASTSRRRSRCAGGRTSRRRW